FGYLTKDLGERKKDAIIKKQNATADLSKISLIILLVLFLGLTIGPWFYLPMEFWSYVLLGLELLLFYVYAFPPFRLKEKGFFGVITDSLYAHVVPTLLASYTFYLFVGAGYEQFILFLILITSWQFVLGIRNIIFHQHQDFENDISSNTNTFVTKQGKEKVEKWLQYVVLPIEVVLFLSFAYFINTTIPYFIIILVIWIIYISFKLKINKNYRTFNFRSFAYQYLDDFYIQWVPLIVISKMIIDSPYLWPLFLIHFFLFRNGIKSFIQNKLMN
ncbi:MAG: UbiA family prenyltransferase, partial [Flavobacteriales bacterium]|nr:UbiA family prenyltransferase [Flavobacteriales bacterium]